MYKQVLIVAPGEYEGCVLHNYVERLRKQVIRTLLGLKQHKLAGRRIDSTTTNDVVMKIDFETSYIFELLTVRDQESNKSQAFERLEALTAIEAAKVYKRVMRQIDDHNTKLILVKYMIYVCKNAYEESVLAEIESIAGTKVSLSVIELSLNILVQLPADLQDAMRHLIGKPSIIVESLLMGCHIDIAAELLKKYPKLIDDEMIYSAARKAVSMAPKKKYSGAGILTGDAVADAAIRKNHYYNNTPNMPLAKSILDISAAHDAISAGKACFRLCDNLSSSFKYTRRTCRCSFRCCVTCWYTQKQFEVYTEPLYTDGSESMDVSSEKRPSRPGSPALWKQCDKYMSCFTLLRTLHMLDIDDVKVKSTIYLIHRK